MTIKNRRLRIPVWFELDKPLSRPDNDNEEFFIYSDLNDREHTTVAIKLSKNLWDITQGIRSRESIRLTRESFRNSIKTCLKHGWDKYYFFIYPDKGVFSLAD